MLVSIILPTYKESKNIEPLCKAIAAEFKSQKYEILIMDDDSKDGTDLIVRKLRRKKLPVSLINRKDKKRGLSPAVIDGLEISQGKYCCVMDADLSHPVSAIRPMLNKLKNGKADLSLGSRYVAGGTIDMEWTVRRRFLSFIATLLALPLGGVKDPMSGFFVLAKKDIPYRDMLSPLGYKIALELIVKGGFSKIYEHPIHFRERRFGKSKMDVSQQFYYLRHLRRLYSYKFPVLSEFVQFGMVGASGFIVDVFIYYVLQYVFLMEHIIARAFSFWISASWNWFWNRTITFSEHFKSNPIKQWISFLAVSLFGFTMNWGAYYLLTTEVEFFDEYRILALMIGVIAGLGFNFMFSRIFIFRHIRNEN